MSNSAALDEDMAILLFEQFIFKIKFRQKQECVVNTNKILPKLPNSLTLLLRAAITSFMQLWLQLSKYDQRRLGSPVLNPMRLRPTFFFV